MDNNTALPFTPEFAKIAGSLSSSSQNRGQDQAPAPYTSAFAQVAQKLNAKSTPADVLAAKKDIGRQDENGWCEQWQEQASDSPNMGTSAANAWTNYEQNQQAKPGLQGAKPGDLVYFAPDDSNQGDGHTGIITSMDPKEGMKFISATDNGVKEYNLNEWQQLTGQQLLGHVPKE